MRKIRVYILLVFVVLVGALLRFSWLNEYPIHLGHDEISQLYDAISISQTGRDIYGSFMPFIFASVNDYKPPFYTYATVVAVWLFGTDEYVIRIPSAFFGALVILGVFLFVKVLFKNQWLALVAAALAAISPFEIFYSRKSFENGAGIFFMLLGFSSLLQFKSSGKWWWMSIGVVLLAGAMYTYFSHAVVVPILLAAFLGIYAKDFFKRGVWKVTVMNLLVWLLVCAPLFYLIATNPDTRERSKNVFISQDQTLASLTSVVADNSIFKFVFEVNFALDRYLTQFKPTYLYMFGLDLTNQGVVGVGPIFWVLLPFTIIGVLLMLKNENWRVVSFVVSWILIGMIPSGVTFEVFSPHRVVMVFVMINIICAYGLLFLWVWLKSFGKVYGVTYLVVVMSAISFNLVYFLNVYVINYPKEKSIALHDPFEQVVKFAWENYSAYGKIIIDPKFGDSFPTSAVGVNYYLAYYGKVDPALAQREYELGGKEGELFGKFSIRFVDWRVDSGRKNTLLLVSPWVISLGDIEESRIAKKFYFRNGNLAYYAISLKDEK